MRVAERRVLIRMKQKTSTQLALMNGLLFYIVESKAHELHIKATHVLYSELLP